MQGSPEKQQVRRKDREVKDIPERNRILAESVWCTMAVSVDHSEYPFLLSTFYVFDPNSDQLIFHFTRHGYANEIITQGSKATFTIARYGQLYTAPKAFDFGCEYESVVMYGTISLYPEADKRPPMQLFFDRFFGKVDKSSFIDFNEKDLSKIQVAAFQIVDWKMKCHRVPAYAIEHYYPEESPVM